MEIVVNLDLLIGNELTLSEYVYLRALYEKKNEEEMRKIVKAIDMVDEDSLQDRGYLKVGEYGSVLRTKAIKLFDSGSLFLKFLNTFPIKTPTGRYLSPLRSTGIKVNTVEKKWNKLFKNKPHLEEKALRVLEAELKWRRETNQMEYINNIETWLNQANYEKYEYLLDDYNVDKQSYEDFM